MFRSGITSGGGTAGVASSILVFVVRVRVLRVNLRGWVCSLCVCYRVHQLSVDVLMRGACSCCCRTYVNFYSFLVFFIYLRAACPLYAPKKSPDPKIHIGEGNPAKKRRVWVLLGVGEGANPGM